MVGLVYISFIFGWGVVDDVWVGIGLFDEFIDLCVVFSFVGF